MISISDSESSLLKHNSRDNSNCHRPTKRICLYFL